MTGEYSGKMPESNAGGACMSLLRTLGRDEILEVLSDGFCQHCQDLLQTRINNVVNRKLSAKYVSNGNSETSAEFWSADSSSEKSSESSTRTLSWVSTQTPERVYSGKQNGYVANSSPASVNSKQSSSNHLGSEILLNDGLSGVTCAGDNGLSEEQKEHIRFAQVGRKKDYVHTERIDGKATNVLQGLELHTRVFNAVEQKKIVECVYNLQRMGQKGQLRARTYSEPRKWMRGKGRVTIQFGCCYNYAVDKNGNPPGIMRDEEVDPLPPLFMKMIKRMVRWHVLPPTCVPNSCIVNMYDEGDCIPPHIDHHDFLRPFCTVSFLTECKILFGANLKILGPGEFAGPVSIPLPTGSVLILNGNGADIAKHCVPAVPAKRISITFRKMDESKIPYEYVPDPELLGMKPLVYSPLTKSPVQQNQQEKNKITRNESRIVAETSNDSFIVGKDDFPPLGSANSLNRQRGNRKGLKQ
uniref:Putative Oxidoreductase n=1 Tax=Davidia involucrata TaxID=16924 RepID=A0A5B7BYQ0_DAVIN